MMFRNSLKLLCANFDKVWKLLLYKILSWAVVIALAMPFYSTISTIIVDIWNEFGLEHLFSSGTFYGLGVSVGEALTDVIGACFTFVQRIFVANVGAGIYLVLILYVLRSFLVNMGRFVTCEMVYGYMATNSKHSFTGTYLRTLNKSLPYAGMRFLFDLPFNALIIGGLYGFSLLTGQLASIIVPIFIILIPALLFAIKETFVAGWAPAMIVFDCNVFRAFPKGQMAVLRRGLRVFSTAFVIYILTLLLAMAIGLYSLVIILPILFPFIYIFDMVMFFSSQGMRFYVDSDTILTPKRLEEVDTIDNAKFLL